MLYRRRYGALALRVAEQRWPTAAGPAERVFAAAGAARSMADASIAPVFIGPSMLRVATVLSVTLRSAHTLGLKFN